jgi:hypothetical protein
MPSSVNSEPVSLPRFPALSSCLLIESSHKSKSEIKKSITATDLFENITLAKSLSDGLQSVTLQPYDACIIGPSLSPESVETYIHELRAASVSEDCAIIVAAKTGTDTASFSHADAVFYVPASKLSFFENIVKGIIISNRGSVWPGVRLNDEGKIEVQQDGTWKVLSSSPANQGIEADFILDSSNESIEKFCEGLQKTPRSKLEAILLSILSRDDSDDPFFMYFRNAVSDWRDELEFSTLKEASLNLKWKLLDYNKKRKNS